ncbi:protein SPEC3-like [Saccostrea cucullata]|uniref:protein SPEC3-like n=1 Tax=Saccostrea cuccullata TaxID=36930 RepID=UPI002ED012B9
MSVCHDDFSDRVITPAMPPCLAFTCCAMNFIFPGSGTIVSGFAAFCCSMNTDMNTGDRLTTCLCNLSIGVLQLVLSGFILVGWCWSCVWGLHYVDMSKKHYPEEWGLEQTRDVWTSQPLSIDPLSHGQFDHQQSHPVSPPPYTPRFDPPPPYDAIDDQPRLFSISGS